MGKEYDEARDQALSATPYDDVFRTLLVDCSGLVYPLLNEIFGEHYGKDVILDFHQNEHYLKQQNGAEEKRITDESFDVLDSARNFLKKYHLECQTNPDNSIALRFFEYDSQIAKESGVLTGNKFVVTYPNSAVLFLRSSGSMGSSLTVEIVTPGGKLQYDIKALRLQDYTIEELFAKQLYILLPYSMFYFEKDLEQYEQDSEAREKLEQAFADIADGLADAARRGDINPFQLMLLIDMMKKTNYNVARNQPQVVKGVETVMGGHVIEDYPTKKIFNAGKEEGREEDREEVTFVFGKLLEAGRTDDLQKAVQDKVYLDRLIQEFQENPDGELK